MWTACDQLPSSSIAVIVNDRIVHRSVAGWLDRRSRTPLQDDSIFRIFSMSKCVTSVAVMILVERGVLALDDDIGRFVPELADMGVWVAEGRAPEPAARGITVRDLLTHRAGLTYGFFGDHAVDKLYRSRLNLDNCWDYPLSRLAEMIGTLPLLYHPGRRWCYSFATDMAGLLVQRANRKGLGFREFLLEEVLRPLKMVDTDFYVPEAKITRLATLRERTFGRTL